MNNYYDCFNILLKHIIERKNWEGNLLTKKHQPKVYYNEDGSIDIDWETDNYGFLINIAKGGEKATYYADDLNTKQQWEGKFYLDNYTTVNIPLHLLL